MSESIKEALKQIFESKEDLNEITAAEIRDKPLGLKDIGSDPNMSAAAKENRARFVGSMPGGTTSSSEQQRLKLANQRKREEQQAAAERAREQSRSNAAADARDRFIQSRVEPIEPDPVGAQAERIQKGEEGVFGGPGGLEDRLAQSRIKAPAGPPTRGSRRPGAAATTVPAGFSGAMDAETALEVGKRIEPLEISKGQNTSTPDTRSAAAEPKPAASHTVKKGENLWNIVKGRGENMSNADIAKEVARLAKLNRMQDPNKIMPGDEIRFEETKITDKFLEAFDKVITSKHSNIFQEAKSSAPKTAKEKELAALAEPKDKITHKDVLVGRGVVAKEEKSPEEYDVTGGGVMTYTDPETGEKKDYVPKIHMKGSSSKKNPKKKMDESIFSEAELAYFEGVGKIAGKPNDKSVPAGKDTSNATGSRSGTLSDEYVEEGRRGRPPKGESLGANELHMNAKRAADNMNNITHTFANGQKVKMTKAMGAGFLARHLAAKTPDEKDALLNHAHSSLSAFKDVVEGKPIPEKKKKGISLAGNM